MQTFKAIILVASLAALAGCASQAKHSDVCIDRWFGNVPDGQCPKIMAAAAPTAMAPEAPRDLAAELAAAQKENQSLGLRLSTVKGLLADREKEIAGLRAEMNRK